MAFRVALQELRRHQSVSRAFSRCLKTSSSAHRSAAPATVDTRSYGQEAHPSEWSDAELLEAIAERRLSIHTLEKALEDCERAVSVRRQYTADKLELEGKSPAALDDLPSGSFDYQAFYTQIEGANCESVIGYMPVPVGVVGPLSINDETFRVPMATTEGALLASTNRGCRAISESGGARSVIVKNGMTRAPLLRMPSVTAAAALKSWVEDPANSQTLIDEFNSTTRFGKAHSINAWVAGKNVYLRFACHCGDAMGMNMVTKGCNAALNKLETVFPDMRLVSMSGNVCADKKPAAINWIEGRGRSVVAEVLIPRHTVLKVLKTTPEEMVSVNTNKNLIGSAVAGSIGGFNAHAANIVAAVFLATGNDPAQVVESSQCLTILEMEGEDLHASVTMPVIEVGTVGGGTSLPAQAAALRILGCQGASRDQPGSNADTLANVVAASVMAGELSLIAALASDDLLKAHIDLNRKTSSPSSSSAVAGASANLQAIRSMHTEVRSFHTQPPQAYASSIGHPSAGGPRPSQQQLVSTDTQPALYFFPGMALEADSSRQRVSHDFVLDEDWYGEGPLASVP